MRTILNSEWSAEVVRDMHRYRISRADLAERSGIQPTYISMVLQGDRPDPRPRTVEAIQTALDELKRERLAQAEAAGEIDDDKDGDADSD